MTPEYTAGWHAAIAAVGEVLEGMKVAWPEPLDGKPFAIMARERNWTITVARERICHMAREGLTETTKGDNRNE